MLCGAGDPVKFLAQHPDDWAVSLAVTERAWELQQKRLRSVVEALVHGTGASVANKLGQLLPRIFG